MQEKDQGEEETPQMIEAGIECGLMGALVRMKPKPHEEMKLGKTKQKKSNSPGKKRQAKLN